MKCSLLTLIAVLVTLPALPLMGQEVEVPRLTQYATDQTGTLNPGQLAELNASLKGFDDSTSTQIVVLMLPTLGGEPIEQYALRVAEENRIGREGKDNGALLLVAKEDRDVRIEVGYGLEGVLTDALSGIIIRNEILPRFRRDDYFGGISGAVEAIMLATAGEYTAEPREEKERSPVGIIPLIFIIFVFFSIFRGLFGRRGRGRHYSGWGIPPIGGGFGGRSGGFGGGGFGGGFGGGGGSFGGGGASGSW